MKNKKTAVELSRAGNVFFALTAFMLNMVVFGENGAMPVVNSLYETYGFGLVGNYLVSGAPLWMAISAVVAGRLMATVTKKKLLLMGSVVFAVGSICCTWLSAGWYVCLMRTLMGVGEGFVNAVIFAYLTQLYVDDEARASFMGVFNAVGMVIGAAISSVAGMLSIPVWSHAFRVFWPMVLVVVAVVLFIPELGMEDYREEVEASQVAGVHEPLGMLFVTFVVDYLLFCAMYAVIAYFVSIYVVETGLGDAAMAGTLISVSTLAGIVTSLTFGKLYGALSKATATLCLAVGVASTLGMYAIHGVAVAYAAVFFIGAAYGAYYTYSMVYLPEIVPPSRVGDAISYTTAAYSILYFCVPFVASWLVEHVTRGSYVTLYLFAALAGCVAIALELATNGRFKRLQSERGGERL